MNAIGRLLASLMVAVCLDVGALRADAHSAGPEGIVWASSFEAALEQAQIEGRIVMIDFWTSWCGWCKRLDSDTYSNPEVVKRSRRMVCVKVNAEQRKEVAARYAVRAYPTIAFVRGDGTLIDAVRGYQPPERFAPLLDRYLAGDATAFTLIERLKDHPDLVDLRYDLGLLYLRNSEADRALEQFDVISKAPEGLKADRNRDLRLDRGRALLATGKTKEAAKAFETYAKKEKSSPRYAEAVYFMAEARFAAGERKDARKWYRKLLEVKQEGWLAEKSKARLEEIG